jgi:CheB methylesterase
VTIPQRTPARLTGVKPRCATVHPCGLGIGVAGGRRCGWAWGSPSAMDSGLGRQGGTSDAPPAGSASPPSHSAGTRRMGRSLSRRVTDRNGQSSGLLVAPSVLLIQLRRDPLAAPLPALHPADGDPGEPGPNSVAPPDQQLVLALPAPRTQRAPCPPAIDPLFCSAAAAYGPCVVGVMPRWPLDGTPGLRAITARSADRSTEPVDSRQSSAVQRRRMSTARTTCAPGWLAPRSGPVPPVPVAAERGSMLPERLGRE